MFGAIAKTYLAQKLNVDPARMVVVSVMPCIAKKYEAGRPEMARDGAPDVDIVITTRELVKMIREAGLHFPTLPNEGFDDPMGESTGAAVIFGASGGVLEAALRTAYEWVTGQTLEKVDFTALRGIKGIKEAEVDVAGTKVRAAVASGLGNAAQLLRDIRSGKKEYHIIEIMACPGGCIDGGGQPYHKGRAGVLKKRMEALYTEDAGKILRKSHENPFIQKLYADFLGKPHGELPHKLLHTAYVKRPRM
jgi:NADH-quinone oxidoreductase subunit G